MFSVDGITSFCGMKSRAIPAQITLTGFFLSAGGWADHVWGAGAIKANSWREKASIVRGQAGPQIIITVECSVGRGRPFFSWCHTSPVLLLSAKAVWRWPRSRQGGVHRGDRPPLFTKVKEMLHYKEASRVGLPLKRGKRTSCCREVSAQFRKRTEMSIIKSNYIYKTI